MSLIHIKYILDGLDKNSLIRQNDVLKYEHTAIKFQLKLQIELTDKSILFTNEYIGTSIRKYAFHWQQTGDKWFIRWDNAPHFLRLASFPHHKHDYRSGSEIVTESFDISLTEVLAYIHGQLTNL